MNPKLKLKVNIENEIENAKWFVKNNIFVNRFLPKDFQYILSERFSQAEKNKIIAEYTKHTYTIKRTEILTGIKQVENDWKEIENNYYKLVEKLFKGHRWPKGNHIGYVSIYGMFPRNVKEKTFSFPYDKEKFHPTVVIAHEMLHFIFFDYIEKKYGIKENTELKGKNPKYVWEVSEAFNVVIENWKPYAEIFELKYKSKTYDGGCEKAYKMMNKQWEKDQDVDALLDKCFK